MSKILLFSFIFLFIRSTELIGQNSFVSRFANFSGSGTKAYSCTQSSDENFIVAAYGCNTSIQDTDLFILKLNSLGDTIWTKFYNFLSTPEIPHHILATADSGFIVTGDNFIMKADFMGNEQWLKMLNGKPGRWIVKIPGGYILWTQEISLFSDCCNYLFKLDENGELINSFRFIGDNEDYIYKIIRLSNGDYVISTSLYSRAFPNSVMCITDSNFIGKATFTIEGSSNYCIETKDKNILMFSESPAGNGIWKLDTLGNILWGKKFNTNFTPGGIDTLANGGILAIGYDPFSTFPRSILIIALDSSGTFLYADSICCYKDKPSIKSTMDGGFITIANDSSISGSMKVIKVAPPGTTSCIESYEENVTDLLEEPFYFEWPDHWFPPYPITMTSDTAEVTSGCIVDRTCFSVNTTEIFKSDNSFNIFPNPTHSNFKLVVNDNLNEKRLITIVNQLGAIVYEKQIEGYFGFTIELNLVNKGIYFVKVAGKKSTSTQKLVLID